MATGLDEDALLGPSDHDNVVSSLQPCFDKLQNSLNSIATGMEKMGQAWQTLANKESTQKPSTGGLKRTYSDSDSDEEPMSVYDDADDVNSPINDTSISDANCNNQESELDTSILDEAEASMDGDEELGADVTPKLANIANKAFSCTMNIDIIKKKQETYPRPKNCERLVVPQINKEIFRRLRKQHGFIKKRDLRFMNVQRAIAKGASAMTRMANDLLVGEKTSKTNEYIKICTDVLSLLGHANTTLSHNRRELLRPVLKSDHVGLCDNSVPVTNWLFGDDLLKTVKEARQSIGVGREYNQQYSSKNWKRSGDYNSSNHNKQHNQTPKNNFHKKKK